MAALAERLVEFCRLLRDRELAVTPGRALDAARSIELIEVADVRAFRAALRANLTISVDEYPAFDAAFNQFWRELIAPVPEGLQSDNKFHVAEGPPRPPEVVFVPARVDGGEVDGTGDSLLPGGHRSANDVDLLTTKDFAAYTAADALRARRLIQQLAPSLATSPSRRTRPASSGGEVDIRRTVTTSRRHGGEVVRLARRRPKLRRLKVVALCDVSGSMDLYSGFLIQFLYALQAEAGGVRTFVFSTRLHDVSKALRRKQLDDALAQIAATVNTWSGGTSIGGCVGDFNARFGRTLVGPRTVVLVISDGWERGDPARLAREMRLLQRRAYSVIWLNPLKGQEGYQPLAAGMSAAVPYVDHFLAANSLESLAKLKRTLAGLR
jgi:uncharacterized protein with von Willebrand factor type A (vWA) domain